MRLPHDGPPYPILVDEPLGGRIVSIWADPDVGVGTFYFYVDPRPTADDSPPLDITVAPADDHAPEATFAAAPAKSSEPFQLVGEVDFDRRGTWNVRFAYGATDAREEFHLPVEVTPPGAGRIDLIWFLAPFLLISFLWIKVFLKRREIARTPGPC